jgi:enoyl-CoA hydratase/carnithine racemase
MEGDTQMKLTSGLVGAKAKGPIGWLIWDNPSKLNALSPGMYEDALSVIEDYIADPAIKVVIMRGAGRKAFISGADIKSFEKTRANAETARLARETTAKLRHELLDLEHGAECRFALRVVRRAIRHPRGCARRCIRAGGVKVAG